MPPSKKRKLMETSNIGEGREPPLDEVETTQGEPQPSNAQSSSHAEEQSTSQGPDEVGSDQGSTSHDVALATKERQARFKALQVRAVRCPPSPILRLVATLSF